MNRMIDKEPGRISWRPLCGALGVVGLLLGACDGVPADPGAASTNDDNAALGGAQGKPAPGPQPTNQCVGESQGGPTSCKDDATWKTYASQACMAKGLTLTSYGTWDSCGAGLNRYVKYTCCGSQPQPQPQPQPNPQQCVGESQGGPTSCKDDATWKTYAAQACMAKGLRLDVYATWDVCGAGLNRYVKYNCCP